MNPKLFCFQCMLPLETETQTCPNCGYDNRVRQNGKGQLPMSIVKNRYLIGKCLGRGGFGITYIGLDLSLERRVAIKEYYPKELAYRDEGSELHTYDEECRRIFCEGRERSMLEARTIARLSDVPDAVDVHDVFLANETLYIVMEYIQGETLRARVLREGGRMAPERLLTSLRPVFGALSEIHRQGVIHRDVSPDNIMFRASNGRAVLLDFGAAHDFRPGNSGEHSTSLRPGYAPVEQYSSKGLQDARTDEYALCATLYFALTGQKPVAAMERAFGGEELPPPTALGVAVAPAVEAVLLKGMALQATDRYPDIEALERAFEQTLTMGGAVATREVAVREPGAAAVGDSPAPSVTVPAAMVTASGAGTAGSGSSPATPSPLHSAEPGMPEGATAEQNAADSPSTMKRDGQYRPLPDLWTKEKRDEEEERAASRRRITRTALILLGGLMLVWIIANANRSDSAGTYGQPGTTTKPPRVSATATVSGSGALSGKAAPTATPKPTTTPLPTATPAPAPVGVVTKEDGFWHQLTGNTIYQTADGWQYVFTANQAVYLWGYAGTLDASGQLILPSSVGGNPVSIIDEYFSSRCTTPEEVTALVLPSNNIIILWHAFKDFANLAEMSGGKNCHTMYYYSNLSHTCPYFLSHRNQLVILDSGLLLHAPIAADGSVTIPEGVTKIAPEALYTTDDQGEHIKVDVFSISLPASLQNLDCNSLAGFRGAQLTIPDGVKVFFNALDSDCDRLQIIRVGHNVQLICGSMSQTHDDPDSRDTGSFHTVLFTGTLYLEDGATQPTLEGLFGSDCYYTLSCQRGAVPEDEIPANVTVMYRN